MQPKPSPKQMSIRTLAVWCVALAVLAWPLSYLGSFLAILTMPLCALVSFGLFDAISGRLFRRPYQPPMRYPASDVSKGRAWSDWLLFVPEVLFFVSLLFLFGQASDCLHGTNVWNGWWHLCKK